ncbi:CinA domain protein [Planctopirus limnophila DSM 3776]|uniref:CinA domain protein n=1 Tax=Planctopirus limnophila (strain ATCC 43296 / DSM 3776 / IFAM 1008 / Mu 290) TaxID=521674 RepID=D5SXD7_PLAL2|nr:nicotinamide-nucleotide amidohydrolase family protein [Planctopirus limnophila]ADG69759.1 CinA domain protein [Planctopirus limnophila DSM 3776]
MPTPLEQAAARLAGKLADSKQRLILAESCTAGLVSATLAQTPGISTWLCGSAVVYQEQTKTTWLGVSAATLAQYTAVSREVAQEMAAGVLQLTPHADIAAAITGHLGPHAPIPQDGEVHAAIVFRDSNHLSKSTCWHLPSQVPAEISETLRVWRQHEVARLFIDFVTEQIPGPSQNPVQNN